MNHQLSVEDNVHREDECSSRGVANLSIFLVRQEYHSEACHEENNKEAAQNACIGKMYRMENRLR